MTWLYEAVGRLLARVLGAHKLDQRDRDERAQEEREAARAKREADEIEARAMRRREDR